MSWSSHKDMGNEVDNLGGYKPPRQRSLGDLVWSGMKKLHTSAVEQDRRQAALAQKRAVAVAMARRPGRGRKEFT